MCEADRVEHVWITVTELGENAIRGRVANEPIGLKTTTMGDEIECPTTGIDDWMYDAFLGSMLDVLSDALGPHWNAQCREAWGRALERLTRGMRRAAAGASPAAS